MPLLTIKTTQKLSAIQAGHIIRHASTAVSEMLNKDEQQVMIIIQQDQKMLFGGSDHPCAFLELTTLDLDESQTADYSRKLCYLVNRQLAISPARIYIEYTSAKRHLWGPDNIELDD